jgi:type IV secretory pathway TraG/TraD family ATPase VirD4
MRNKKAGHKMTRWLAPVKIITFLTGLGILSCWLATLITAYQFHFQSALGTPLLHTNVFEKFLLLSTAVCFMGWAIRTGLKSKNLKKSLSIGLGALLVSALIFPFYNPLDFFYWWWQYHDLEITQGYWTIGFIILSCGFALIIGSIIYFKTKYKKEKTSDTHGTAHFATIKEIEQTSLLKEESPFGMYVGAWQDPRSKTVSYLRFAGAEHVFIYAPSRSGKGVGLVIPSLLSYRGSMIISDFKGENWQLTAGWRQSIGQHVFKFDPTDPSGTSAYFKYRGSDC